MAMAVGKSVGHKARPAGLMQTACHRWECSQVFEIAGSAWWLGWVVAL